MNDDSKKSILFFGKKDDQHCLSAVNFIESNFPNNKVYLGKWKDDFPKAISSWEGDYVISYLSRWIVPSAILNNTEIAAINFHPGSPNYPGIGCNNFALYYEEEFYGVTCHHMLPNVDTGRIIATRKLPVHPSDTVSSLLSRTYDAQLDLFYEIMGKILRNEKLPVSKEKWTREPFTRKEFNELAKVTPDMENAEVRKRIRATSFKDWQPVVKIGDYSFEYKEKNKS